MQNAFLAPTNLKTHYSRQAQCLTISIIVPGFALLEIIGVARAVSAVIHRFARLGSTAAHAHHNLKEFAKNVMASPALLPILWKPASIRQIPVPGFVHGIAFLVISEKRNFVFCAIRLLVLLGIIVLPAQR